MCILKMLFGRLGGNPRRGEAVSKPVDDYPSLDLIFEETKRVSANLERHFATLDAKSNFQVGAGTLMIAGITLASQARTSGTAMFHKIDFVLYWRFTGDRVLVAVTVVSLLAFFSTVLCSFMAYRLRPYSDAPLPSRIQNQYMLRDPSLTKRVILGRLAEHFDSNLAQSERKQMWVSLAHKAILVQGFCLALAALLSLDWR